MKSIILVLLISCHACFAQSFGKNIAFLGASVVKYSSGGGGAAFSPTNVAGYPYLGWWCVSSNYVTNSSIATLSDLGTNSWNLTNQAATTRWPQSVASDLNGYRTLSFDSTLNTEYLVSTLYTSKMPHEVVMVVKPLDDQNGERLFDGRVDPNRHTFNIGSTTNLLVQDGNSSISAGAMSLVKSKWFVFNAIFADSTHAAIYTNGVLAASGNPAGGTVNMGGLVLSGDASLSSGTIMHFAEMASYSTNLGAIDSSLGTYCSGARSNIVWYFTNKYNITQ